MSDEREWRCAWCNAILGDEYDGIASPGKRDLRYCPHPARCMGLAMKAAEQRLKRQNRIAGAAQQLTLPLGEVR